MENTEKLRIVYPTKVMRVPRPLVAAVEKAIDRLHSQSAAAVEGVATGYSSQVLLEPEEAKVS